MSTTLTRESIIEKARALEVGGASPEQIQRFVTTSVEQLGQVSEATLLDRIIKSGEKLPPVGPFLGSRVVAEIDKRIPVEDIIPPAFGTAGAIALSPLGIPGAIGGAVAGGTTGEVARQTIRKARGKPTDFTGKPFETGALEGTFETIGGTVFRGLSAPLLRKPLIRGIEKGAEFVSKRVSPVATDLGQRVGAITEGLKRGPVARKVSEIKQQIAERTKLSEDITVEIERKTENLRGILSDSLEKFTNRFGKARAGTETGKTISKEFDTVVTKKFAQEKALYEKLPLDTQVSNVSDTKEFIEEFFKKKQIGTAIGKDIPKEILEQAGLETGFTSGRLVSPGFLEDLRQFKPFQDILKELDRPDLTFGELKNIRTLVGEMADFDVIKKSGLNGPLKKLFGVLTQDMKRTAKEGGFSKAFEEANTFSREFFEFLDTPVSKSILKNKDNPENIVDALIATNSPTKINTIFKEFSEDSRNVLRRGFLDRLAEKPGKFSTKIARFNDETLTALFGAERTKSLRAFQTLEGKIDSKKLFKELELPQIGVADRLTPTENAIFTAFNSKDNVSLVKSIIRADDPLFMKVVMDNLDEPGKDALRKQILTDVFDSKKLVFRGENLVDPSRIAVELDKFSEDTIRVIYGKDADVILALKDSSKFFKDVLSTEIIGDIGGRIFFMPFRVIASFFNRLVARESLENIAKRRIGLPKLRKEFVEEARPKLPKTRQITRAVSQLGVLPFQEE